MPKKNIREMSSREKLRHSLSARTFNATILGAVILGLVALLIGLGLYGYALAGQYVNDAYNLTRNVETIADNVVDIRGYGRETMAAYENADDEMRSEMNIRYLSDFAKVRYDENFSSLMGVLTEFTISSDVQYLYVGMYDLKRSALVFIADADEDRTNRMKTGMWMEVETKEAEKFLGAKPDDKVYHITYDKDDGWICTSGVPIFNDDGTIACFILADVSLKGVLEGMRDFVLQFSLAIVLVVLLFGFIMSRYMKRAIVRPINKIAEAAVEYVDDKRSGSIGKEHFKDLGIDTGDEIENLYFTLSDMENDLNTYEKDLTNAIKEKERIGTELHLSTRIQADMLPTFPAFTDRSEFEIFATMIPAKEVGGDFYDFFLIDDDHLALVIADVSGKGVPAALFMMSSKILIKSGTMTVGESPSKILELVNEQIVANNKQEMFVTVWLGILEISTGKLTCSNAGHEYPVVRHPDGEFELIKDKHGFVLGGMEGMKYKDYEIMLEPGSEIFVYTDGVTEATNEKNELFGTGLMLEALNSNKGNKPKELIRNVVKEIGSFTGQAPRFDDITMLSIKYMGPHMGDKEAFSENKERVTKMKEMTIEATIENIPQVTAFVDQELEALDCPVKAQMQIDIAIDELFGNIAQYAYDPSTGPATVRVEVAEDPMAVIITFIDHGKPYDPLKNDDPDVTLSAEERNIGGLGVFLVKKTMDEITYEYKDGQNILKIRKNM